VISPIPAARRRLLERSREARAAACWSPPRPSRRPWPPARWAVDDAGQYSDWHRLPEGQPGLHLHRGPLVHSHFAGLAALAAAHQDRSACRIEVAFGQRQRFADAQPGAPRHDEQSAQAQSVCLSPGAAHDTTKGHSDRASDQTLDRPASKTRTQKWRVRRASGRVHPVAVEGSSRSDAEGSARTWSDAEPRGRRMVCVIGLPNGSPPQYTQGAQRAAAARAAHASMPSAR
jgi:hypothetical protein